MARLPDRFFFLLMGVLFIGAAPVNPPAAPRLLPGTPPLHPYLRDLVKKRSLDDHIRHGRVVLDERKENIMVFVVGEPPEELESAVRQAGGEPLRRYPGFISAFVPLTGLPSLRTEHIVSVDPVRRLIPHLDKSLPAIKADVARLGMDLPRKYTGQDVIVGLIDTGIDLSHPAFQYPDGSTRVIYLWDQTIPYGIPPEGFSYGRECTGEDINQGRCPENDCGTRSGDTYIAGGHGTHVAGIAAGGAVPYHPYTGVAPSSLLVFVRTDFVETHVIDAIEYVFRKGRTLGKPVVVNLSAGVGDGPHDGTTPLEKAISALALTEGAIVVSSGNDGGGTIHAGYTLSPGTEMRTGLMINPTKGGEVLLETWYSGSRSLGVAVGVETLDGGAFVTQTGFVSRYSYADFTINDGPTFVGQGSINATKGSDYNLNRDNLVVVTIYPGGNERSYRWELIVFSPTTGIPASVDSWMTSDNAEFDPFSGVKFTGQVSDGRPSIAFSGGDERMTINRPATAPGVIAAGSFASRLSWIDAQGTPRTACGMWGGQVCKDQIGGISYFSSRGPSRDESFTGVKPTLAAPGEAIISALSYCTEPDPSRVAEGGGYWITLGTSMAAPHVAGAIALLLDRNSQLAPSQIASLLTGTAFTDSFTGSPLTGATRETWGAGKLNVYSAITKATAAGVDTTPPAISGITVRNFIGSTLISWETDELASGMVEYRKANQPQMSDFAGTMTPSLVHRIIVENLANDQRYEFRVSSMDPRGNISRSSILFFRTPFTGRGCGCTTAGGASSEGAMGMCLMLLFFRRVVRRTH